MLDILQEYGRASDHAGNEEVIIGRHHYPLMGAVRPTNLGRWQNKITTGDYSHDSDPSLSAYAMASFAGGMGNHILKEGVDDDSYWTATMETRHPNMICNLPQTLDYGPPSEVVTAGMARGIADYPAHAPMFHAAFDQALARWDRDSEQFVFLATLPSHPAGNGKGFEFNGKLFIPCGPFGIAVWDGDVLDASTHEDIHAVGLTIYDNRLAAITQEGYLRIMKMDETWEAESEQLRLPSGSVPTGILTFIDQRQSPCIHVITSRDVYAYDRDNMTLMRTHLQYPKHPHQGRGSTVWRGDSMYVSVGIGIHAYTGATVTAMGPDGRYGLPASLRGYITDLEQEYNGLLALVQGASAETEQDETFVITPPQYEDDKMVFPEVSAKSTLLRWNQRYWHPVWESEGAGGTPTNVLVSEADGGYRLWWGYDGRMYTQILPIGFHNPKVGMQIGHDRFQRRGMLTTGWFDADMPAFTKLAAHVELVLDDVFGTGESLGEVTIRYQIDQDPTWYTMRTVSGVGRFICKFGVIERADGTSFSEGTAFDRIRFRIESTSRSETVTPVIQSILFKYIKIPMSTMSWTMTVDLSRNEGYRGVGNDELRQYIHDLIVSRRFSRFVHRDKTYRVRVAQAQGDEVAGFDERSMMTISLIEVRIPPDDPSGAVPDLGDYTGYG